MVDTMEVVRLVVLSFFASIGFGIVFRIHGLDLIPAGLGGALTRFVYIMMMQVTDVRLMYTTVAAVFAALYGEFLANATKDPSTFFIYPSIIPLIPGDLFYYTMRGIIQSDAQMFTTNGSQCLLALAGMSIGFVLASTVAHHVRMFARRHPKVVNVVHLGGQKAAKK